MNAPTSDAVDRLNAEKDSVPFGMTEELARRLSAVMFTDVVGYTALMQEDEEAARVVRLRHRRTLEAAIAAAFLWWRRDGFARARDEVQDHLAVGGGLEYRTLGF